MRCPFRKETTHNYDHRYGEHYLLKSTEEDFMVCYKEDCPYYKEDGICEKVRKEIKG